MSGVSEASLRGERALLFTCGAVVAGASLYAIVGIAGLVPGARSFLLALGIALALLSSLWHLSGRDSFRGDRQRFQAKRSWVNRGRAGLFYFGAVLGVGLLTEMSTPLVYAGAALAAASGPLAAAAYGVGFGLGRSVPPWVAVAMGDRAVPAVVGLAFIENGHRLRWLGALTGGSASLIALGSLTRSFPWS